MKKKIEHKKQLKKKTRQTFGQTKFIHFVGIGGIGMSGIAHIVASLGYSISGSDLKESETILELREQGAQITIGKHAGKNLPKNIDVLVTSSAISPANPEVLRAKERSIPIIRRAEMLAEIMRLKTGIAIAGTHGKTTTTSLITSIFEAAEFSPTSIIGGKSFAINSNAKLGESDFLICEADESDGSFLDLSPVYSVITNIDWDHMDFYGSQEKILLHFLTFINKTPFYGKSILCFDDANVIRLAKEVKKPFTSYGVNDGVASKKNNSEKKSILADVTYLAENLVYERNHTLFQVRQSNKKNSSMPPLDIKLAIPGRHNVLNAMAAIAIAKEVGIDDIHIQKGLENFPGVERRLTSIGHWENFHVIDDYGHHPKEILATLHALRPHYQSLTVVFQPHRYSRTLHHFKDFAEALSLAHHILLAPIYAAGEAPIENVSSQMIATEITSLAKKKRGSHTVKNTIPQVTCLWDFAEKDNTSPPTMEQLTQLLKKALKNETPKSNSLPMGSSLKKEEKSKKKPHLLITMGAGDIYKVAKILCKK